MSVELLLAMNASCGACAALGPPPSAILTLPPPPLPTFLKQASADGGLPDADDAPCDLQGLQGLEGLPQGCDWSGGRGAPGVEYVELPRQVGGMGVPDDDTWFLVLVSCCAGVLLLGAVLAVILMRCRQGGGGKCVLSLDPSALDGHGGKASKLVAGPVGLGGEVLYPDPRALWAALTPSGGTQHFVTPQPPVPHLQLTQRHLTAPSPPPPAPQQPAPGPRAATPTAEPEYAMPALPLAAGLKAGPPPLEPPPPPPVRVAAFAPPLPLQPPQHRHHGKHPRQHGHINKMATLSHAATLGLAADTSSFDNSGFVDSDDHDHEAYALLGAMGYYHTVGGGGGHGGGRRGVHLPRPKVSSPTRIAHPNLPPLNLHPSASVSASATGSRRSLRKARHEAREARHAERDRDRADRHHHHASSGALAL